MPLIGCSNPPLESDCNMYFTQLAKDVSTKIPSPDTSSPKAKFTSAYRHSLQYETSRLNGLKSLQLQLSDSQNLLRAEIEAQEQFIEVWQSRLDFLSGLPEQSTETEIKAKFQQFTDSKRSEFQEASAVRETVSDRWLIHCRDAQIVRQ